MFEAEFSFNTSESFSKDLAVIVACLALAYGLVRVLARKQRTDDGDKTEAA